MKADDLGHLKKATAILTACVVQTLNESDPSFQERFLERLARAYRELKDNTDGDVQNEMELLAWTRELLTGFNMVSGKGEPFLGG
ncbi:hypothetical protein [Novosphingobium sp.]|uniref:hypothetical protein n=1 Tax=Novosphingobium sp. TaxID=1874826 RepID=UPI0025FC7A39|nr:hypothetical protein [Novosphingobium sp.]MCC6925718.1 hypothetical protein [Novosphingobium sp.]